MIVSDISECKQVQTGADGFGWVRWDVGDTGGHKNKARRNKNGRRAHDLRAMAGEISPDIMFSKKAKKNVRMIPSGCKWVYIGAIGCRGHGGPEKQVKRRRK